MGELSFIIVVARVYKIAKNEYKFRRVCPSVRPSACNDLAPTGRIFVKFYIGENFFRKSTKKM